MDLATLLGLAIALIGILVGQAIEGGSILQIMQPTAAMIVCGGTLGATMIGFPLSVMKQAAADFLHIVKDEDIRPNEVIESSSRLWEQPISVDAGYLVCLTCFVELD